MRSVLARLALFGAAIAVVISCDSALPTAPRFATTSTPPTTRIDTPTVGTLVNVGDSILVTAHVHDDRAIKSVVFAGYTVTGSVDLGTWKQTARYSPVTVPATGTFRAGLTDTVIRRYLQPVVPIDTTLDSLVIRAIVTNASGLVDSASVRVNIVSGPHVTVLLPAAGDSISAGTGMRFSVQATQGAGISQISVRVMGDSGWPTPLDTTFTQAYTSAPRTATFDSLVNIPANARIKSRVTILATASDVNRQPGSASPVVVFVRSPNALPPRVTQVVPARVETTDSIAVSATGQSLVSLGFVARDSAGRVVRRDSIILARPYAANASRTVGLNLPDSVQGSRLAITAFAVDSAGHTGYAVSAAATVPIGDLASAVSDSALVVFGHTYPVPHAGTIGDVVVDPRFGDVLMSNMSDNRLEVWQNTSQRFDSLGVAVGSEPWGLFVSNAPDTLLVANSGGTNLSRVYIGTGDARTMHEDLSHRILTRNAYIFVVKESRDPNTGKLKMNVTGPILYSDRPQYVGQLANGTIFFSTRPTATATPGTVRYIDPSQAVPDLHQIVTYSALTGDNDTYVVVNADSVFVRPSAPNSLDSDTLTIFDHPPGTALPDDSARSPLGVRATIAALQAVNGSDVSFITGIDISKSGLTDTTFVAVSGDRKWIAFGSGNSATGQIFMTNTAAFFSPITTTQDLLNNASERVFGLALDSTGSTVLAHGQLATYFANVEVPFHLRLQGELPANIGGGGGVAFHPRAQVYNGGFSTNDATRLAFVAATSSDGTSTEIDIVDAAYYTVRGRLQLKGKLYGPIRATGPLPGDPSNVVLRLFGLSQTSPTQSNLVSIAVTAADIHPVP